VELQASPLCTNGLCNLARLQLGASRFQSLNSKGLGKFTQKERPVLRKNWDWIPESQKLGVILKKKRKGKPNSVALTEAGLLTRDGFNSAGLCIVANALASDKWRFGVPLHIILNKIISSPTLNDAMTAVLSAKRASSNIVGNESGFGHNWKSIYVLTA